MALAAKHDVAMRTTFKPGDFIVRGTDLVCYHPAKELGEDFEREVNALFLVGNHRTTEQDVRLMFNQLAEVAIRALSPGVNDPYTAMTCVDWLGASLCELAGRRLPSP